MHRYLLTLLTLLLAYSPLLAETKIEGLVQNAQGELVPASPLPKTYGPYGITVRVLDEAGAPVSGAFIFVKSGFQNHMQGHTGADGRFAITHAHPEPARVAVIHPDYAPLRLSYRMGKDHTVSGWRVLPENSDTGTATQGDAPADIILKPAKPAKIRLLDKQGKPVPNAAVMWAAWWQFVTTEHSPSLLTGRTDANGELLWNCAPTGPASTIRLGISPEIQTGRLTGPQYMRFTTRELPGGEEIYEITVPRPLTISGSVTNAVTGERITKFTLAAEIAPDSQSSSKQWSPWDNAAEDSSQTRFPDGRFRLTMSSCGNPGRPMRVCIAADGYNMFTSPEIPWDAGDTTMNVILSPSHSVSGVLLQPDGQTPAAEADIILGNTQTRVRMEDGRLELKREHLKTLKNDDPRAFKPEEVRFFRETGEDGRFLFPKSTEMEYILAAHATGWAHVRLAEHSNGAPITLQPWGEVKGRVMWEGEPVAKIRVQIQMNPLLPDGKPSPVEAENQCVFITSTDEAGYFAFRRVLSGTGMLGYPQVRFIEPSSFFKAFSHPQKVRVKAGKITQADMGTAGQNFFGRLEWTGDAPNPAPWERWQARLCRKSDGCIYYANFAADGTFRIYDVPAGKYDFMFGHLTGKEKKTRVHSVITIPPRFKTGYGPPHDLGVLRGN